MVGVSFWNFVSTYGPAIHVTNVWDYYLVQKKTRNKTRKENARKDTLGAN